MLHDTNSHLTVPPCLTRSYDIYMSTPPILTLTTLSQSTCHGPFLQLLSLYAPSAGAHQCPIPASTTHQPHKPIISTEAENTNPALARPTMETWVTKTDGRFPAGSTAVMWFPKILCHHCQQQVPVQHPLCELGPTGFKVGISYQPHTGVPGGDPA